LQLLDEKETAALLNCTPAALRRMRRERRGVPFCKVGRLIRYNRQDIEEFVRQSTQQSVMSKAA
jgi:excisionase family DNA binding protein